MKKKFILKYSTYDIFNAPSVKKPTEDLKRYSELSLGFKKPDRQNKTVQNKINLLKTR